MSDLTQELYVQHRTSQDQYAYFILAAAGAAIAFSVQKTLDAKLTLSLIPLAAAVFAWGVSFYFGCRHLSSVQFTMLGNMEYLQLKEGTHPKQPGDRQTLSIAIDVYREEITKAARSAGFFGKWCFRLLILGGVLFIGWHIYEMYLRTVNIAS